MTNRGLAAFVTIKYYLPNLIDEDEVNDLAKEGITFEDIVKEMIDEEDVVGMADSDFEILNIEKVYED